MGAGRRVCRRSSGARGLRSRGVLLLDRNGYQHCGEQHLRRYMAEFDFRYNTRASLGVDDQARAAKATKGAVGKRLTYRSATS